MLRRHLLATALAAPALWGRRRMDFSRLSLLTDEVGRTPADSIAFCHQYGVRWVELRTVPGHGESTYAFLDEPQLRDAARELKQAGLRVSFLNTPLLKFTFPGSEPARKRTETAEQKTKRLDREKAQFDRRLEDLDKAIRACHIFGVRQLRVFTFTRVADPAAFLPTIVPVMEEMIRVAEHAGVRLLVENEGSCNVATSPELAAICRLLPQRAFGVNWDPVNALPYKEQTWPDGYRALPIARVHNVQMKARGLVIGPDFVDWKAVFDALIRDGYKGHVGLETHVFDGTLIEKAHLCMKKLGELMHS
jgi:sugar phosphate isomerase/epimerase